MIGYVKIVWMVAEGTWGAVLHHKTVEFTQHESLVEKTKFFFQENKTYLSTKVVMG